MAAMLSSLLLSLLITVESWQLVFCKPSPGVWDISIDKTKTIFSLSNSAFTNTQLSVTILCENDNDVIFNIYWIFGKLRCVNYFNATDLEQILTDTSDTRSKSVVRETLSNYAEKLEIFHCSKNKQLRLTAANFTEVEETKKTTKAPIQSPKHESPKEEAPKDEAPKEEAPKDEAPKTKDTSEKASIKKRDAKPEGPPNPDSKSPQQNPDPKSPPNPDPKSEVQQPLSDETSESKDSKSVPLHNKIDHDSQQLLKVPQDGFYLMVIQFSPVNVTEQLPDDFKLKVNIRLSNGDSYIAAVDHPLLYFYSIMGLVYICYGIIWLFMLACNWRDLLRVQFWIGGVILLGMLEKAVFFAEYENINKTGQSVRGAIIFAELVSCLKRTLARMLVIIVSLGYGIVKPRLGQTFHKILAVGLVFFILASIEGCMRALAENADQSKQQLLPGVPLAVTDALIFFWIFTSLLQTTRTLRLRRNVVKLSLYRHFTNTLIFTILASVAFMIWSLTQHKFKNCLSDWKELWLDEAFWHLLFSIILIVIMILWRPTVNNQRYAFSPLLDAAEDELDDDVVLSEAYDGMKMRSKQQQRNGGSSVNEDGKNEDDLKWVEENIPTSFADKLLPALDSDEEIMNTKFEVSKME